MKRIIYRTPEGGLAVIVPSPESLARYGIESIAFKDVPSGLPFKIVDEADIPSDRTFRGAWEADLSIPDGIGSESNEFSQVIA